MDAQSQSEHPIGKGISRRTLAQVLAAGAVAATAGTPAFAQQTSSMSEASPQDYVRDPTRWGSPEVAHIALWRSFADRKRTRLNSSHGSISYAVFCMNNKEELLS